MKVERIELRLAVNVPDDADMHDVANEICRRICVPPLQRESIKGVVVTLIVHVPQGETGPTTLSFNRGTDGG